MNGDAGAQGYSFCDQLPGDSKTVFTSIFFPWWRACQGKAGFQSSGYEKKKKENFYIKQISTKFYWNIID